jgi:hypothetical protein
MESVGAIPECVLRDVANQISKSLDYLHNTAKLSHNGLNASQVLFN